jgi:hypothetical protein
LTQILCHTAATARERRKLFVAQSVKALNRENQQFFFSLLLLRSQYFPIFHKSQVKIHLRNKLQIMEQKFGFLDCHCRKMHKINKAFLWSFFKYEKTVT